jgi:hypothetical protein
VSAAKLLDRLEGVRRTGPDRWLARCPAHEDRAPSLSIRELGDGRVLIHDFAGCDVDSVLGAVGLELADLFPPRDPSVQRYAPTSSRMPAGDALAAIDHEAHVAAAIAADAAEHREVDEPTWARLALAARRIGEARAVVAPLRVKP